MDVLHGTHLLFQKKIHTDFRRGPTERLDVNHRILLVLDPS